MDARAISVVKKVKDDDNPVSLILAETLWDWMLYFMVEKLITF